MAHHQRTQSLPLAPHVPHIENNNPCYLPRTSSKRLNNNSSSSIRCMYSLIRLLLSFSLLKLVFFYIICGTSNKYMMSCKYYLINFYFMDCSSTNFKLILFGKFLVDYSLTSISSLTSHNSWFNTRQQVFH